MSEVFLSYARDDEPAVRRVAKALEAAGYRIWWDSHLPAHRDYSEEIERRLEQAKAVIVLWSKSAAQSQWVRAEADFARSRCKLVQAQLDDGLPPMPFNQIQSASLKGWRGNVRHPGWEKLAASVAALVNGEEPVTRVAEAARWWTAPRVRWLAAASALLFLVAALVGMRLVDGGETKRPVVAVLPFESLDPRDASLVAGIWEDTRQAIGRNPQLMVLGPNSAKEIAQREAARRASWRTIWSRRASARRATESGSMPISCAPATAPRCGTRVSTANSTTSFCCSRRSLAKSRAISAVG